ncbi:MAG: hypothetical protein EBX50_17780, partial [Chitinophagia bacterium]|nr:hypothetical protein [Chitinophagia bacterium]
ADISNEIEEFDRRIKDASEKVQRHGSTAEGAAAQKELDKLREAKASRMSANANNALGTAASNTAVTLGQAMGTIVNGVFNFAKNLQSGASGVDTGSQAAIDAVRATSQVAAATGGNLSSFGQALALLPGPIKAMGLGMIGLGQMLEAASKSAEIITKAIDFLRNEVNKTTKSYRETFEAGAVVTGGLVGLRQQANSAGLGVAQFSSVVNKARDDLALMGMGMGEAAKYIGGASRVLRNSPLGDQLTLLGYSFEEQAALSANLLANQRASGDMRIRSDEEIAKMTNEYGKSLRVISDLTGKDAKRMMERARTESMRNEVLSKLNVEEGQRLQRVLQLAPEQMQRAILQKALGQVVTDIPFLVAAQQQPALMGFVDQTVDMIRSTMNPEQVTQQMTIEMGRLRDNMRATAANTDQALSFASLMTNNISGNTRAAADITNQILAQLNFTEQAAKQTQTNVEATANNTKGLNGEVLALENATQKMRVALEVLLTDGPLEKFVSVLRTTVGIAEKILIDSALNPDGTLKQGVIDALQNAGQQQQAKTQSTAGATMGAAGGAYGGAVFGAGVGSAFMPVVGTAIGGALGALVGGTAGYFAGKAADRAEPRAMGGGIFPNTTYLVGERGPELVTSGQYGRVMSNTNSRNYLENLNSYVNTSIMESREAKAIARTTNNQLPDLIRTNNAGLSSDKTFQNDLKNILQENNMINRQQIAVFSEMRDHVREMTRTQGKIYQSQV